jgi:hypothetical protein
MTTKFAESGDCTMLSARSTHYWLWFLAFGLLSGIATRFTTEFVVVTITGLLGLLAGVKAFKGIARFYDLVIGLIFTVLGLIGIVASLGLGPKIGLSTAGNILGLQLGIPYSPIHLVLGLTSLNYSIKPSVTGQAVTVATERAQSAA